MGDDDPAFALRQVTAKARFRKRMLGTLGAGPFTRSDRVAAKTDAAGEDRSEDRPLQRRTANASPKRTRGTLLEGTATGCYGVMVIMTTP